MSDKRGKKRPKSYYIKCAKKPRQYGGGRLDVGMKGFLVTCNKREKDAVREMYNILNEYADLLYGKEKMEGKTTEEKEDCSDESEEEDLEKAMQKEITEIKDTKNTERRFQNTNTKVTNCIFIRTTLENPCTLAHYIFTDLFTKKQQKARSAIRLLPVSNSCKAFDKDIKKMAEELFKPHFETPYGTGVSYTIIFKTRNNSSIGRESILPMLSQIIRDLNPLHRVNHNTPDVVVLVEIVGNICCMSIVKDFFKFRKYNLHEVVKDRSETIVQISKETMSEETLMTCDQVKIESNRALDSAVKQKSKGDSVFCGGDLDKINSDDIIVKGNEESKNDGIAILDSDCKDKEIQNEVSNEKLGNTSQAHEES